MQDKKIISPPYKLPKEFDDIYKQLNKLANSISSSSTSTPSQTSTKIVYLSGGGGGSGSSGTTLPSWALSDRIALYNATDTSQGAYDMYAMGEILTFSAPSNAYWGSFYAISGEVRIVSGKTGTQAYVPIGFYTSGLERVKINTDGSVNFYGDVTVTGTLSAPLTPSGLTTGYIPYKTSTVLADSPIYTDATKVGIATAIPYARLDVSGTLRAISVNTPASGAGIELSYSSGEGSVTVYDRGGSAYKDLILDGLTQKFYISGSEKMRIDSTGKVGIGTTSPGALLDVEGTQWINGHLYIQDSGSSRLNIYGDANAGYVQSASAKHLYLFNTQGGGITVRNSTGYVGIGTTSPNEKLSVGSSTTNSDVGIEIQTQNAGTNTPALKIGWGGTNYGGISFPFDTRSTAGFILGASGGNYPVSLWTNSLQRLTVNTSGEVGIGTTTPSTTLDVNGYARFYTTAAGSHITIDGDSGYERQLDYSTGNVVRWKLFVGSTAETGSNAGSDFTIQSRKDDGTYLRNNLNINRASGDFTISGNSYFNGPVTASGNITVNAQHILISDTGPRIQFSETDGGTDAKNWDLLVDGGLISFRAINDAWSTNLNSVLQLYRAGDVYINRQLYVGGSKLSDASRNLTTGTIKASGNIEVADTAYIYSHTHDNSSYSGYQLGQSGSTFNKISTNELHTKSFIADIEMALVGGQVISKSVAKLWSDCTIASGSGALMVEEIQGFTGQVFEVGDYVRLRDTSVTGSAGNNSLDITEAWLLIVTYNGRYTTNGNHQSYTVTLQSGSNGTYPQGSLAIDYGQSGNGILERVAISASGNKPYDRIATWDTAPYTDLTTLDQRGDLSGLTTDNYGTLSTGLFGTYSQSAFFEKNVNIAGTLTAGDANGFGSTFYAGLIAKNLITYSQDFSTSWSISGPTLTSNALTAPDGTTTGSQFTSSGSNNAVYKDITVTTSTNYVFSWWAKEGGTLNQLRYRVVDLNGGTGDIITYTDYRSQLSTTAWTRISLAFTTPAGCTSIRIMPVAGSTPTSGEYYYFWGVQLEKGIIATPYQKTDGTVSSSTDYGIWASSGGFGGTMQNPVVGLSDAGLQVQDAGYSGSMTGGTYIGNWAYTSGNNLLLNPDGIYGYQGSSTPIFYLDNTGAQIANWTINATKLTADYSSSPTYRLNLGATTATTGYGYEIINTTTNESVGIFSDAGSAKMYMRWYKSSTDEIVIGEDHRSVLASPGIRVRVGGADVIKADTSGLAVTGEVNATSGSFSGTITSTATINGGTFKTTADAYGHTELDTSSLTFWNGSGAFRGRLGYDPTDITGIQMVSTTDMYLVSGSGDIILSGGYIDLGGSVLWSSTIDYLRMEGSAFTQYGTGYTFWDFNPYQDIRFFRNTNSASTRFYIMAGDNTANTYFNVKASSGDVTSSGFGDFNTIKAAGTQVIDASGNSDFTSVKVGGTTVIDSSRNITNIASLTTGNYADVYGIKIGGTIIMGHSRGLANVTTISTSASITSGTTISSGGNITSGDSLITADPFGGSGTWRLGKYKSGGSGYSLKTTAYVQVRIDGTVYKLALIN